MEAAGERLQQLRKVYRYSQRALSRATEGKVSQAAISQIEHGQTDYPSMQTLTVLAPAFNITPSELNEILLGVRPVPSTPVLAQNTYTANEQADLDRINELIVELQQKHPSTTTAVATALRKLKLLGAQDPALVRYMLEHFSDEVDVAIAEQRIAQRSHNQSGEDDSLPPRAAGGR